MEPENAETCLNCGVALAGGFCSNCGQAADVERYSVGSLSHEVYGSLRKIDLTTTVSTFLALIRYPGDFIDGYLDGKRVGYTGPIKFFFYSIVAEVIVRSWAFWLTGDQAYGAISLGDTRYQITALVSTLFWALFWKLFYRHSGLNIAEFAVCALFFESQANLITILILLISIPLKPLIPALDSITSYADILIVAAYGFYFAHDVFNESWPKTILKQLLLLIAFTVCALIVFSGASIAW